MTLTKKFENSIKDFWDYFEDIHKHLLDDSGELNENTRFELSEKLKEVEGNLCLEIMLDSRQIIISADGIEEAFEAVEKVCEERPQTSEWEIVKYRQPIDDIESKTISSGDYIITLSDILYDLVIDEEAGIVLIMFIPAYEPENKIHEMLRWMIVDNSIGEYDAVKKVGYFDTYSTNEIENIESDISAGFKTLQHLREDLNLLWEEYTDSK